MERKAVNSSLIKSIGYDRAARRLEIEFKAGVWQYDDVPPELADQLVTSPSIGSFFHTQVRPAFPGRKVA